MEIDIELNEELIITTSYKGMFTGKYIFKPKLVTYDHNTDECETKYSMQEIKKLQTN